MSKPKHPTIPMSAVKSSQIESIGHLGDTLAVRLKRGGPEYRYSGVSVEDFNKLRNAYAHVVSKCGLMRAFWTHGAKTDIQATAPACEKFEGKA